MRRAVDDVADSAAEQDTVAEKRELAGGRLLDRSTRACVVR
jgi:hypothetical protein